MEIIKISLRNIRLEHLEVHTKKMFYLPHFNYMLTLLVFSQTISKLTKNITVPIANHDNNQHAENENIRLKNLFEGIETMAALMLMK